MTRPQPPHQQYTIDPAMASRPVCAEHVLPEHVLLRWLHDGQIVAGHLQPNIEFALQLAATISASQSLAESILDCAAIGDGEGPVADDGEEEQEVEHDCFDFADLASEFGISTDSKSNAEQTEQTEDVTMTNEFDTSTASDPSPQATEVCELTQDDVGGNASNAQPASDNAEPSSAEAATEAVDNAIAKPAQEEAAAPLPDDKPLAEQTQADENSLIAAQQRPKRISSAQSEDAELGALMAETVRPGAVNAFEEQQQLQARFRDPEHARTQSNAAAFAVPNSERQSPQSDVATPEPDATATEANSSLATDEAADQTVTPTNPTEQPIAEPTEAVAELPVAAPTEQSVAEPAEAVAELNDASPVDAPVAAPTEQPVAEPAEAVAELNDASPVDAPAEESTDDSTETVIAGNDSGKAEAPVQTSPDEAVEQVAEIPQPQSAPTQNQADEEDFALTNASVDRVQDFLGELKSALVEMAQRPQAPAVDMQPLVQVLQAGFDRSAEQSAQASTAVASLSEHLTQFGRNIEGGVAKTIDSIRQHPRTTQGATAIAAQPQFVERSSSQAIVVGAVALLALGWSILFWIKTGSPRLALGTLIGANAIACCLLLTRRDRN